MTIESVGGILGISKGSTSREKGKEEKKREEENEGKNRE